MILLIPLNPVPAQTMSCSLSNIQCRFWVRQLATGLYLDLWCHDSLTLAGIACLDRVALTGQTGTTLPGQLYFMDRQGTQNPDWANLGSRFLLCYKDDSHG